jgi:hypothetical protein
MIDRAAARCPLCDIHGYRPNGCPCDHVDRRPIYERGMAECRAILDAKHGRVPPAPPPPLMLHMDGLPNVT